MGRLSISHQEKGEEVFPLEESPRAEASHGEPTSCVKSGIGGLTGRAASPAAARRSAPLPAIRHLEPQRDAFCPTSLRKVLLQLLQHHVRLRKLEFAWGPLLKTRPELRAWEERPREAQRLWNPAAVPRSHREAAVWRPPRPARTHCCRRRAATSPRSCPSAAWRGSPSPSARGPAGAAPGSGPRRCARRLVSSCCGERGEVRARPRPAAPAPRRAPGRSPVLDDDARPLHSPFLAAGRLLPLLGRSGQRRLGLPLPPAGRHGAWGPAGDRAQPRAQASPAPSAEPQPRNSAPDVKPLKLRQAWRRAHTWSGGGAAGEAALRADAGRCGAPRPTTWLGAGSL